MATSHSVEKVVIMAASQVAKSELLMNVMGYYIDQEPSSIMMIQPTDLPLEKSIFRSRSNS